MPIRSIVIVASLLLAGCQTTVADTTCTAFQPITYSGARDTPETVAQVRRFNAAWLAICQ